jgi:hypothetical protein
MGSSKYSKIIRAIQVYDSNKNTSTIVPTDQLTFNYYKNLPANQIEIEIVYSQLPL